MQMTRRSLLGAVFALLGGCLPLRKRSGLEFVHYADYSPTIYERVQMRTGPGGALEMHELVSFNATTRIAGYRRLGRS